MTDLEKKFEKVASLLLKVEVVLSEIDFTQFPLEFQKEILAFEAEVAYHYSGFSTSASEGL